MSEPQTYQKDTSACEPESETDHSSLIVQIRGGVKSKQTVEIVKSKLTT